MKREALIQNEDILCLIPQRPPIVMVDKFFGMEKSSSYTGLTVTPSNLFCKDGELQESGIIEHIAQSAATRIGYLYTQKEKAIPLGYIGSVDKLQIYRLPKIGEELFTEITVIQEVFDIALVAAQVASNDEIIAKCRMKIFLSKEEQNEEKIGPT